MNVLSIDIGGTKIASALVDENGRICHRQQEAIRLEGGPEGFIDQLKSMAKKLLAKDPLVKYGAIASAGPLHPKEGVLLNPTNLKTNGKHWGRVPLVEPLQESLGVQLQLENDAAAAVMAEHWMGQGQDFDNCMIITLGTGVGIGTIINGLLVRAGRGLHPEASHIYICANDQSAPSGSGDFGSVEAYLSGKNFSLRVAKKMGSEELSGEELLEMRAANHPVVVEMFEDYGKKMAQAINSYVVLYAPEVVIFAGGFAKATPYFIESTRETLKVLLASRRVGVDLMPRLVVSNFTDDMGLLGAGYIAHKMMESPE